MGRRAGALLLLVGGLACADEPGTVPDAASPDASTNGDGAAPDTASGVDARAEDATVAAPPLDPGLPTSFAEGTAFLYSGEAPLQTGVAPGTIDPGRVAVLRGKVITRDGDPLEGVTVAILGHPELGRTQTRRDGWFDLAVNGGGALTVTYARSGFLPAQRGVIAPWLDYRHLPDVALIVKDPMVTPINLNAPAMQVARASVQNDADGARRATVLFPAGTGAELVQPDGSTRPASTLNVRLTEYTVGVNGPAAMPGQLPPTSGYTYAVELGADEAVAKVDGRDVIFSQPVLLYLENFVDIPVGEVVPAGYYDPDRGSWFAADNGLVLAVVGVNAGLADLDVTGDGVGDGAASLATYNITDSERAELARLYPPGTTLWRTPLDHFSTIDCNWSVICSPGGCSPPQQPPPPPPVQCNSSQGGSLITCERQTLGEGVALAGTPHALHYSSDRVPGRMAEQSLLLSLAAGRAPDGVLGTEVELLIAGQKLSTQTTPDRTDTRLTWDGKDAYGRDVVGSQRYTVRLGYTYRVVYAQGAVVRQAWARLSGVPLTGSPARMTVTLWQEYSGLINRWNNRAQGLGGWSLSPVHGYDPVARILHLGDGSRRDAEAVGTGVIDTIAGTVGGFGGDGGPASQARLSGPFGLAPAADGSLYVADEGNLRIRRIGADGTITTVAGNGTPGDTGDGGPALAAQLRNPKDVALGPDGSLYVADSGAYRVRRVHPDGTITTVAGNGALTPNGDDGPAIEAGIEPWGIAVSADGVLYIADRASSRIRAVDQNGIISTFAGSMVAGFAGDGGPATDARLSSPTGVALAVDGTMYIADRGNNRVRRVDAQGVISTVAGSGAFGALGDGGPATAAQLAAPYRVAVAPDGTLLIADEGNQRVRFVGSEGIITTLAGTGAFGLSGDRGVAARAELAGPSAVAASMDGAVYIADRFNTRVRRVAAAVPHTSAGDVIIPSSNGAELYVFNGAGRHLRTLEAYSGAVLLRFAYDSAGLASVDEGEGNLTRVERDAEGRPAAIVAPDGQRTTLAVDPAGFLGRFADPTGAAYTLTYGSSGLLATMQTPGGGLYRFGYDLLGRLVSDADPAGGEKTLSRLETTNGATVTIRTALGQTTAYAVQRSANGTQRQVLTSPGGARDERELASDGTVTLRHADGTVDVVLFGPDPRWGMQAPLLARLTRTTPGGLTTVVEETREAVLSSANDPLSLSTYTERVLRNGRPFLRGYRSADRTWTETSPEGRVRTTVVDARGRASREQPDGLDPTSFSLDGRGRLAAITDGLPPLERVATASYGPDGFLASITDPLGRVESRQHDAVGRLVVETASDINSTVRTTRWAYDGSGNLTGVTPPGEGEHKFTYSPVDLLERYESPGGAATAYSYDTNRRLVGIARPDGRSVGLAYDDAARLERVTIPGGELARAYDSAGRLASAASPSGITTAFTYDGELWTGFTQSGPVPGSLTISFDASLRRTSLNINGSGPISSVYDGDGLLTRVGALDLMRHLQHGLVVATSLGVVRTTIAYNGHGEVLSADAAGLYTESYTRDALGRIATRLETIGGVSNTYDYTYDPAGRLSRVVKNGAQVEEYEHDANGRRTAPPTSVVYTYGAGGELLSRGTDSGTTAYEYDALGDLTSVRLPDATMVTYLYDAFGRRSARRRNGTLDRAFLYESATRVAAQLDASGAIVSRFVYASDGGAPAYMERAGVIYRILSDHVGSARLVVNTTDGTIAQRLDYDSFGNVLADSNPGFQPFAFAGGLYDADTKLLRFGRRDYDPQTGRFIAQDPYGFASGDTNLSRYAAGDPVNFVDREGTEAEPGDENARKLGKEILKKLPKKPKLPSKAAPRSEYKCLETEAEKTAKKVDPVGQVLQRQADNINDSLTGSPSSAPPPPPRNTPPPGPRPLPKPPDYKNWNPSAGY